MSEEMYVSRIAALKKQYEGSSNEEFIKGVFMEAFKLGKEVGFDAGYNLAVGGVDDTEFDDYDPMEEEDFYDTGVETFDSTEELLNT